MVANLYFMQVEQYLIHPREIGIITEMGHLSEIVNQMGLIVVCYPFLYSLRKSPLYTGRRSLNAVR